MIEFVSATRSTQQDFRSTTALGRSLPRLAYNRLIVSRVTTENTTGLPTLYNRAIDTDNDNDILVFLHDDVFIDDYFIGQRIVEGLKSFDIIGLAGTRRRLPNQSIWASIEEQGFSFDKKYLSGLLAHGNAPDDFAVTLYGPAPAPCELLDGVFLAARKSKLRAAGVRFDERFQFHFYDLDFCRTARNAGLRLGTWPIAVTHQSAGVFGSPSWLEAKARYFEKWGD
jgi:GT2 family glycosyltransferase